MSEFKAIRIGQAGLEDRRWQEFFDLLQRMKSRYHMPLLSPDWKTLKKRLAAALADSTHFSEAVILKDGVIVGWVELHRQDSADNTSVLFAGCQADFAEVPMGFVRQAGATILEMAETSPGAKLYFMTGREEMTRVVREWGGHILNRLEHYCLNRSEADHDLLSRWRREGQERNPELKLISFESVPEEHADRYCELFRLFWADMPKEGGAAIRPFRYDREELRRAERLHREQGTVVVTVALVDRENRMIAHSNVLFYGPAPRDAHQAMTGVDRAYRGRGLAKWLKAELFTQVGEKYPANETFRTEMRAVNEPMQAINREMGYRLENRGHEIELPLEALQAYVRGVSMP